MRSSVGSDIGGKKEVSFRLFDFQSEADCSLMSKWENDPAIKHLFCFFADKESSLRILTADDIRIRGERSAKKRQRTWMILLDSQPVGEMNLCVDGPNSISGQPGTAWIGIVIGEAAARGCGVGQRAMQYLEEQARAHGAKRIELGVFEFNSAAIQFYEKLEYIEFTRIAEFAFWKNRMWDDIRMLKEL